MGAVKTFTPDWLEWIEVNSKAGVTKDVIFQILFEHGFAYEAIQQELDYTPNISLERLKNPHKALHEFLPNYTKVGFQTFPVPELLFEKILRVYGENKSIQSDEYVKGYIYNAETADESTSTLIELPNELRTEIQEELKPMMAAWCGVDVIPTYVYGIRTYKDKAVLKPHRDRIQTHIFGIIINVDQVVREEWVLTIEDHAYEEHQVILKPGEMIFYESARLKHGRATPFEGSVYANVFCHFKPVNYIPPN